MPGSLAGLTGRGCKACGGVGGRSTVLASNKLGAVAEVGDTRGKQRGGQRVVWRHRVVRTAPSARDHAKRATDPDARGLTRELPKACGGGGGGSTVLGRNQP